LHRERKGLRSHGRQVALLLLLRSAAFAQTAAISGDISGKVADEFGAPVAGASIAARNSSGQEFKSTSGAGGEYSISTLTPGLYDVTISIAAMQPFSAKGVTVEAGKARRLDAALRDGDALGTLGDGDRFSEAFFNSLPKKPVPEGPAPRMPDGTPDLSGYWIVTGSTPPSTASAEAKPWAATIRYERRASEQRDNPYGLCLPRSIIESSGSGKFVQTKDVLAILLTGEPPRQIFLDGRGHPVGHPGEINPTWQGHSIGHWEGDTLVVDTVGFNGRAWYGGGLPSTEALHVIERYTRADLGHLSVAITIEDPAVLERPWTGTRNSTVNPTGDIDEYICTENNRDAQHLVGK
jgi:hypothetical protein